MTKLLSMKNLNISDSESIIGFELEDNWYRYLTIDGQRAFYMGNHCSTCDFFFERLEGANRMVSTQGVSDKLNNGLKLIDSELLEKISIIMPVGSYVVSLIELIPQLMEIGCAGDYFSAAEIREESAKPNISYYLSDTNNLGGDKFFEFIIPLFPIEHLNLKTINKMIQILNYGGKPTALAISLLEIREAAHKDRTGVDAHLCLSHYLLDGHHKTYASSQIKKPITLLSFLAIDHCIALQDDIKNVFKYLSKTD